MSTQTHAYSYDEHEHVHAQDRSGHAHTPKLSYTRGKLYTPYTCNLTKRHQRTHARTSTPSHTHMNPHAHAHAHTHTHLPPHTHITTTNKCQIDCWLRYLNCLIKYYSKQYGFYECILFR
jgi:hypothetical protein